MIGGTPTMDTDTDHGHRPQTPTTDTDHGHRPRLPPSLVSPPASENLPPMAGVPTSQPKFEMHPIDINNFL